MFPIGVSQIPSAPENSNHPGLVVTAVDPDARSVVPWLPTLSVADRDVVAVVDRNPTSMTSWSPTCTAHDVMALDPSVRPVAVVVNVDAPMLLASRVPRTLSVWPCCT